MSEMRKLKDLIAPGMTAIFVSARRGDLIYRIGTFSFAVPIADMGDGEFLARDKAIFFMRWIRNQLEARDQERICRS